jgi:hypothetical protein
LTLGDGGVHIPSIQAIEYDFDSPPPFFTNTDFSLQLKGNPAFYANEYPDQRLWVAGFEFQSAGRNDHPFTRELAIAIGVQDTGGWDKDFHSLARNG